MRFQDIPAEILIIRVERTDNATQALQEQPVLSVAAKMSSLDEFEIRLKDFIVSAKPVKGADSRRLNSELTRGRAILAQLANPAADGSIELQIAFFTGERLEMGDVEIGVDEYVENAISKIERSRDRLKGDRLYRRLDQFCCFRQGDSAFFFLTAGPAIDDAIKPEPSLEEDANKKLEGRNEPEGSVETEIDGESNTLVSDATQTPRPEPTRKNSFCVTGDGIRFVASEAFLPGGKSIFIATRMSKHRGETDRALRLAKGNICFVDWTQAGQVQLLAKAQMTALTKEDGSYLKNWDEFGDLEGELLLTHAREIGALHYSDMTQNRDGTVSIRILQASDSALNALSKGNVPEVEIVDGLPDYIRNESLAFKEFVGGIEKEAEYEKFLGKKNGQQEVKSYFKVMDFDAPSKVTTLATETLPIASGTLILSLAGETAQIKRRMAARRAILEGRAANPQLGLLIERNGEIAAIRPPQKIVPLTAFVRDKVFRNPPTVMQQTAIEVALNTPDIAIIQGPPGTGKTTVIAAILERLNEMANKRGVSAKGQVLLTGFQHDAVENMIERLTLNSIPVPKFGKRSGAEEDDFSAFEKRLEEWCGKLAAELRERNPQIAEIEQETEIKNQCLQYVQAPTRALAANLARLIVSLGANILGEEGVRRASNLAKNLSREEGLNDESNRRLSVVQRLRVRSESFADDGPERATDALDELKDDLDENELTLLDTASLWRSGDGVPSFLNDLVELKKALLVRFAARPVFRVAKKSDEVIALADEAIRRIKVAGHSAKDSKSTALAEFLAELESNPYGMIDAVSEYSFAFAATCQQSVNKRMQFQKGIDRRDVNNDKKGMEYEYVIVDEAARVSPRDLMVPMVQGKRIILVGDHRQLPHMIDDEVARQMEEGETGQDESDWLKKSMFQYLFSERLKALEGSDGIIRCVTLDKQFRMHPLLGDFISRNFYERFDPVEKFDSGRPVSAFAHNLQAMDGKPAAWLDVKAEMGKHLRSGTSWTRPAEASAIARQLLAWMNSDAGENLTFAVISFYKAQADLIKKQLGRHANDEKRLRVGTVDSFQGMEFDVVFLSMVRTLPQNWNPKTNDREKQARTLFGHLCLYNRLNVSMSRQKKLLIVAGDSDLLQGDLATEFIPGMVDFFKLCQEEREDFAMSLKFLDYSDPVPFSGIIGKARNLAWPVHAYRVTLPRATDGGDGLNPFERVVLKLLDAIGAMDASTLADETRIPLDLVNSILLRLKDKALIDEHNRIIEQDDDDTEGGEENASVFVTAILFRELVTGKILPFLHWLDETNPLRTKDEVRQFLTIPLDDAHKVNPPAPRDVISILRAVNKRSTVSGGGVSMPSVQQITIIRQPESYCLDCPIAIQKSDGEFRIADPFGNGFSLILESAFEKLLDQGGELAEWLQRWKLLLSNPSPTKPGDRDQLLRETFESEVNLQRYPKLVASLRPSQEKQFRSIAKIYASIEWALFYVCCRSPFENAISKLKFTGQSQHHKLLESAALSIGLEAHAHNFRPIREGKLLDFQNGKAELDTVLAINILQAQVDESHPLRRISFSHPNIISRLLDIKKMRDEKSHGKGSSGQTETELSEDPLMREIVHYLLPDIIFAKQASVVGADKDARADDLLDARTSIQNEFSFKVFNRLGTNLQNRLIHAERFWYSCKDDSNDARSFADDLYAAVQSTFEKRLDGKLPPHLSDSEFVSAAGKKASAAGLSDALPNCLSKVKTLAIRQTLQGSGQTLGACTMAFLLMSEGDTLLSIAAMQPSFVDDIANVISTRGHGNEPLPLPKADIKILRKASYTTIKTLMEA